MCNNDDGYIYGKEVRTVCEPVGLIVCPWQYSTRWFNVKTKAKKK